MLMQSRPSCRRRGSIIPFLAVALVALVGFVALAIDLGMLMLSRTQCQAAADAASLTGARELTGDPATNYNKAAAVPAAQIAVTSCSVLNKPVKMADVKLTVGSYRFDVTQNKFVIDPTGKKPSDAWTLVQAHAVLPIQGRRAKDGNRSAARLQKDLRRQLSDADRQNDSSIPKDHARWLLDDAD